MVFEAGGPAQELVSGSNPADLSGWTNKNEDMLIAQATSLSGQFAKQWILRMVAQEAT